MAEAKKEVYVSRREKIGKIRVKQIKVIVRKNIYIKQKKIT
jgi:hypothetical protein